LRARSEAQALRPDPWRTPRLGPAVASESELRKNPVHPSNRIWECSYLHSGYTLPFRVSSCGFT
jgi:hypothetical protein